MATLTVRSMVKVQARGKTTMWRIQERIFSGFFRLVLFPVILLLFQTPAQIMLLLKFLLFLLFFDVLLLFLLLYFSFVSLQLLLSPSGFLEGESFWVNGNERN